MRIYTLELDEKHWLDVEYDYEPGDPGIHTYPNGDPGVPGTSASVTIKAIRALCKDRNGKSVDVDILPYLELYDDLDPWMLEEEILKEHNEK